MAPDLRANLHPTSPAITTVSLTATTAFQLSRCIESAVIERLFPLLAQSAASDVAIIILVYKLSVGQNITLLTQFSNKPTHVLIV